MRNTRLAVLFFALAVPSASAQFTGPNSSQSPYLLPAPNAVGVQTVSLLTVGDSVGTYRLAGIPDGMGAFKRSPQSRIFGLVVNHELQATAGALHAHGSVGSFVSLWVLDPNTKGFLIGRDLINNVNTSGSIAMNRLCSGDLADRVAYFPNVAPDGPEAFIFLSGEEAGAEGRAFAHITYGLLAGQSYELPSLGNYSWENALARPYASPKTVVVGLDDSTPGQVYVYVGDKQPTGTLIQQVGLEGGTKYGIKVPGVLLEDRSTGIGATSTHFDLANLGDVSALTGAQLETASDAAGVTEFLRPEDGCWDPADARNFYFVTTDRFNGVPAGQVGRSRLWLLRFDDVNDVTLGGTITMLLDGTEGQQMMDNMCIDRRGHLLIQEDPGNQAHIAKIWQYDIATDALTLLVEHDAARFITGGASFITQDEESSGIFDASTFLGPGWFIANVQAHTANPDPALVEYGQLVAIFNPASL